MCVARADRFVGPHPQSGNKHRNHPAHTEIWGWRGVRGGLTALIMGFRHADDPAHTLAQWHAPGPTGRGQQKRARSRSPPPFCDRKSPQTVDRNLREEGRGGLGGSLLACWPLRRVTSRQEPLCWPVRGRAGPCTASRRGLVGTGAGRELKFSRIFIKFEWQASLGVFRKIQKESFFQFI